MSPLLYQVACRIDGSRGPDAIAALVSADLGRSLDAEQVRYLVAAKLLPLGVVAGGVPRALPKANPLFSLRARGTLLPERAVNLVGAFLRPLFQWPFIVAVAAPCWPWTTGCSPSTGWAAGSGRSCATQWICSSCSAFPWSPPCSTSAGTRPAAATAARDRA